MEVVPGVSEIIRKPTFMTLTDKDEAWLKKRLESPSAITSADLVGIRLARHYASGGEAVGYRHPLVFLAVDGIPERFHENRGLRAALAMCKFPSGLVCTRTDTAGRDYWDSTKRGWELYHRLSERFDDYTQEAWFIRAMSGDVVPRFSAYQGRW